MECYGVIKLCNTFVILIIKLGSKFGLRMGYWLKARVVLKPFNAEGDAE